ncbi:MAG: ABC transporter substrate-binding protein [Gammaproteobacteria bacterium]|nr:ABC transporter substrate-binding protein [Gammaproteobacteria bacterium]
MGNKFSFNRRVFLQAAGMLALMPWLSSCVKSAPLKISGHKWPGYEILFMARDLGWLEELNVTLVDAPNASSCSDALRAGQVQGAMLTLGEAILLCSEGMDLKIILLFDISIGADMVLLRPELTDVQQLRGKTLGYENTATGELMLHEFLHYYQLEKSELKLVNLTLDKHERAWQEQQLDALITVEPVANKIVKAGANIAFGSRQVPDMIFNVLVVTQHTMDRYQNTLEQMLRVYFRALHHFRTNPMDASHRIAKRLDMKAEDILQLYYDLLLPDALANYAYLSEQDIRLTSATQKLVSLMQQMDIIGDDFRVDAKFTNQFIPRELL